MSRPKPIPAQVVAIEIEKVLPKAPLLFEGISQRDMRIPLELRPGGRFRMFGTPNPNISPEVFQRIKEEFFDRDQRFYDAIERGKK